MAYGAMEKVCGLIINKDIGGFDKDELFS